MLSSGSPIGLIGKNTSASVAAANMQQTNASSPFSAYADRPQLGLDVEFGADLASGAAFFQSDGRKHDDLKQMLDSNKDGLKLEAMKRIIGMIARGRDASDLFPAVVKNVVSKNIEVKKLVYVYLVRYAEEQQDLALLSISTFQRALKDPNQLIRASALRVLSSIRVNMIVPIVMLAIRDSAADLSPYVRKTAAHAIPKLHSLDPEQKDELVMVIEKLLSDRTTLVVGSAVMAFDEVCPERVDLIHKNYRKLCNLLVDVDEWGQVIIINMLTRYARTQFVDPNADDLDDDAGVSSVDINADNVPFYNDEDDENDDDDDDDEDKDGHDDDNTDVVANDADDNATSSDSDAVGVINNKQKSSKRQTTTTPKTVKKSHKSHKAKSSTSTLNANSSTTSYHVDLDHRLLLRQTKPLLQSRNASVVMAVAQLYHHVAPRNEIQLIAKALIRLLRSHKEVQSVVLNCIASMSTKRKSIFEPHIKSFFVRTSDATHLKLLKLDILTNLASATTISLILREFQTYITSSDRSFVAASIQAIGRCAASIKAVTETCLSGLVHLLSSRDEHVVAESVVVIKRLLQTKAAEHYEIISQMAKLIDYITVPAARASIIWLIGEYNEKVPKIAPDVLRKMAKTFVDEEDVVKLQILNLGVKLYLTNPQQTSLLCQYVFTLARYDSNYDVRDRARFLRQFIFPASGNNTILTENARKIFLSAKPAPLPESKYRNNNNYQLGSLSHYLNMRATGYKDLPKFPEKAPDSSVRNIEGFMHETTTSAVSVTSSGRGACVGGGPPTTSSAARKMKTTKSNTSFLTDSDDNDGKSAGSPTSSSSSSSSSSDSDSSDTESSSDDTASEVETKTKSDVLQTSKIAKIIETREKLSGNNDKNIMGTSDSASSSYSSSGDEDESEINNIVDKSSSAENNNKTKNATPTKVGTASLSHERQQPEEQKTNTTHAAASTDRSNLDLLLDLDDIVTGPVMTPSLGGFFAPGVPATGRGQQILAALQPQNIANCIEVVSATHIDYKHKELLNKVTGHGLQLSYRYTRVPDLCSSRVCSIEFRFQNLSQDTITDIIIRQQQSTTGMQALAEVKKLSAHETITSALGVDFNESTHAIDFELESSVGKSRFQLKPNIGELIRAVKISVQYFREERIKLRGLNEYQTRLTLDKSLVDIVTLKRRIHECLNVAFITAITTGDDYEVLQFAAQTLSSKCLLLITLDWKDNVKAAADDVAAATEAEAAAATEAATESTTTTSTLSSLLLSVNCEKMVIGSLVLNELRALMQSMYQK